jgi:hypothetical protein
MKTKSIRICVRDALEIERATRELAVELDRAVSNSEVIGELVKYLEEAKNNIKNK